MSIAILGHRNKKNFPEIQWRARRLNDGILTSSGEGASVEPPDDSSSFIPSLAALGAAGGLWRLGYLAVKTADPMSVLPFWAWIIDSDAMIIFGCSQHWKRKELAK